MATDALRATAGILLVGQRQLRNNNGWKAAGVLALFGVFLCVMLVVPSLHRAPEPATDTPESGTSP
jgi:hypothetical protein